MEDIIVDEPSRNSLRNRAQKKVRRIKPKRDFSVYLFDWLVKAIMIALLVSIDFVLFSSAGNFELFSSGFTMSPEAFLILVGIFAISLVLMFLISFSTFLQNIVTAAVVGVFVYVFLNQFALFDKFSFIASLATPYLGSDMAANFMYNSDKVITIATAIGAFVFLAISDKKNIAYFTGILIVIFLGILASEYLSRNDHKEFQVVYDHTESKAENGKKFIYILLPNAGSISYLHDMKEVNADKEKVENTMDVMLGFFAQNNFSLYPNAYVVDDNPVMNLVKSFNSLSAEETKSFISSDEVMNGYWGFKNLNDENTYLKNNQLYDIFQKAKYKISAYKSRGLDLCSKNRVRNADRCVEKNNRPISFDDANFSAFEKTELLLAQWVRSMGIFQNFSFVNTLLKAFYNPDSMPLIGVKYDGLYTVNSPKTLEIAAKDIIKDKGSQAYFIYMDLPTDMFVYNEYCRFKPVSQWLNMETLPWVINKNLINKRSAYLDQTMCLYGKMEQFMQQLNAAGVLDRSVIVIQGLRGVDDLQNIKERLFVPDFKNKKLVTMAIRDPLRKSFEVENEFCTASDILNQYLFKKGHCIEMNNLDLHMGAKKELKGMLGKFDINSEMTEKAETFFKNWFKNWEKVNLLPKGAAVLPMSSGNDNSIEIVNPEEKASANIEKKGVDVAQDLIPLEKSVFITNDNQPKEVIGVAE